MRAPTESSSWSRINAKGKKPSARQDFALASHGKRVWIHGGNSNDTVLGDLYTLDVGAL